MDNVTNALIVGGQKRTWAPIMKFLISCRIQILAHWHEGKDKHRTIPVKTDIVVIIASSVSHALQGHAKAEAEKLGVRIIYTSHTFSDFPEKLKKWGIVPVEEAPRNELRVELEDDAAGPLMSLEEMSEASGVKLQPPPLVTPRPPLVVAPPSSVETKATSMSPPVKHHERTIEKLEYLKELLRADPAAPYEELNEKIGTKFPGKSDARPGGISKPVVTEVRWKEHGLRYGPGGRLMDKTGKRRLDLERGGSSKAVEAPTPQEVVTPPTPKVVQEIPAFRVAPRPEANVEDSKDRLRQLATELRNLMPSEWESVVITREGSVKVRKSVEQELSI